ncbi:hypothetical protein D5S17_23110 [Pseudonocardiaceae bacterium YIM PH 21723]|nr:hypothetical protein D5S17_23110 [Pseudonocardiaceae bacterium YIM PH 21723]
MLVLVPHMPAADRLFDILPLFDGDHRIQQTFVVPDLNDPTDKPARLIQDRDGHLVSWLQARHTRYDLALSAGRDGSDMVDAPVVLLAHGATKYQTKAPVHRDDRRTVPITGLERHDLIRRGHLVASALMLANHGELRWLREVCPEAEPTAVVGGDLCFDRMRASARLREVYRQALGVADGQRLVLVSSTWRTESTFGRHAELVRRLLDELPHRRYVVCAALHPNIWETHSGFQVRSWLADCLGDGLRLLPDGRFWQASVMAADLVLGDHGSVTQYSAACDVPVVLAATGTEARTPNSVGDLLSARAPVLDMSEPLQPQLDSAIEEHAPGRHRLIADLVTGRHGESAAVFRETMYRLLDLPEPDRPAVTRPYAPPQWIRP